MDPSVVTRSRTRTHVAYAHNNYCTTIKWRPNVVVDLLEGPFLLVANLQATKILWYHGPAHSEAESFRAKIMAKAYGSDELACLKKEEEERRKKMNISAVLLTSGCLPSRRFLATLRAPLGTQPRIVKVRSL